MGDCEKDQAVPYEAKALSEVWIFLFFGNRYSFKFSFFPFLNSFGGPCSYGVMRDGDKGDNFSDGKAVIDDKGTDNLLEFFGIANSSSWVYLGDNAIGLGQ